MRCNIEIKNFFDELKEYYIKRNQEFVWNWDEIETKENKNNEVADFVYYIAYNLSKNILHGPLPRTLDARMVFSQNKWSKKYFEYLEGKIESKSY